MINSNLDPNHTLADGFRFSLRQLLFRILCISIALAVLVGLAKAIQSAQRDARSARSQCPLNQLQLALQNYHLAHGCFPPAFVVDESGTPMHSWRVLILPFIEESALYDAYDFTEPWNGPNNSKLANQMPSIFCSPSEDESNTFTNFVVITGPGTAFPGSSSTSLSDFVDGAENTILLTEIANSRVPWLQPRDIDTRTMNDSGALTMSAVRWRRPYVVFADRIRTFAVHKNIPPDGFRALTTIAGGESWRRSRLMSEGYLE